MKNTRAKLSKAKSNISTFSEDSLSGVQLIKVIVLSFQL